MLEIDKVYPELFDKQGNFWYIPWDYEPLLKSFGYDIVLQVSDEQEGEAGVIFRHQEKYGLLSFPLGHNQDTDPLQACENYGDIEKLRQEMRQKIRWDDAEGLLAYIMKKNWEIMQYNAQKAKNFVRRGLEVMKEIISIRFDNKE